MNAIGASDDAKLLEFANYYVQYFPNTKIHFKGFLRNIFMLHHLPERCNYLDFTNYSNSFKGGTLIYKYEESYYRIEAEEIALNPNYSSIHNNVELKLYPRKTVGEDDEKTDYVAFYFNNDSNVLRLSNFKRTKIQNNKLDKTAKTLLDSKHIIFLNDSINCSFKVLRVEDFSLVLSLTSKSELNYLPHQNSSKSLSITITQTEDIDAYCTKLEELNFFFFMFPITTFAVKFIDVSTPISDFFPKFEYFKGLVGVGFWVLKIC
mmetsp:Transcript_30043/g.26621  ORF Transcript_30043/g.26621 Transcript_30043/m.26621 type:complete len:263 (+) Transcript_30043:786-1574(+)